jgi:hypothetical protein
MSRLLLKSDSCYLSSASCLCHSCETGRMIIAFGWEETELGCGSGNTRAG